MIRFLQKKIIYMQPTKINIITYNMKNISILYLYNIMFLGRSFFLKLSNFTLVEFFLK
jgi:hypothetical protein